jgi:hypothetical protein
MYDFMCKIFNFFPKNWDVTTLQKNKESSESPMQVPSHFKDRDNDEKAQ